MVDDNIQRYTMGGGATMLECDNSTIVTPLIMLGKNSKMQNIMQFEDIKEEENHKEMPEEEVKHPDESRYFA